MLFQKLSEFKKIPKKARVLTVGSFDGVHLGHQKVIKEVLKISDKKDLTSSLLTFEPIPKLYFGRKKNIKLEPILSLPQKISKLKELGLAEVFALDFELILNLSAVDFVSYIQKVLAPKIWVVGSDFKFGKNRVGDATILTKIGKKLNFEVVICNLFCSQESAQKVSSTQIRALIKAEKHELVKKSLGWEFEIGSP